VRLRPSAALSAAAVAALLLAGCSGAGTPDASPTSTEAGDLCAAQAAPGAASDAVTVDGEPGTAPTATFTAPLEISELQATVLDSGEGDAVAAGDFVSFALTAYSAQTGEMLDHAGYEPGELLPAQISPESPLGQILGCGAPGERVVAAFPATETAGAEVYVLDLLSRVPTAAWGTPQEPVAGMPTVTLAEDGAPSVTLPDTDPPAGTTIATTKAGDGETVASGDQVLLQYYGVRWSNGETFDSTWDKGGTPIPLTTTGVVAGFGQALEGQNVGSQVLVVIPPADGYGEGEINETDLKGETLVFVIDILGTQHPRAQ